MIPSTIAQRIARLESQPAASAQVDAAAILWRARADRLAGIPPPVPTRTRAELQEQAKQRGLAGKIAAARLRVRLYVDTPAGA